MWSLFFTLTIFVNFTIARKVDLSSLAILEKVNSFRMVIQPRIYPNHSIVHRLIQDDFYVRQWLAEDNFVVGTAAQHFMEHLAWRHEHHIDTIHLENWDYFQTDYPQFINLSNDTCNTVCEVWTSDWNIHRAVLSGKSKQLMRWSTYQLEMAQRKISENRMNPKFQANRCTSIDIVDMIRYSTWEHGCIHCLNLIVGFAQLAEKQYPNIWTKVYMVNAGPLFRQLLVTLGRSSKSLTTGIMKIYGSKHEWLPILEKEISKDQRSQRFGGNLVREMDER